MAHSLYGYGEASAEKPADGESKMDFLLGAQSRPESPFLLSLYSDVANNQRRSVQTALIPGRALTRSDIHGSESERVAGRRISRSEYRCRTASWLV